MALIKCADCGKEFSDAAAACPNCGRPNVAAKPAQAPGCLRTGCLGFLGLTVVVGIINAITAGSSGGSANTSPAASEPFVSKYEAQDAVKKLLRDPESAQFDNVFVHRGKDVAAVCGSVNAKNGFGGYTGGKLFFVVGSVAVVEPETNKSQFIDLWNAACADASPTRKTKRR